MHTELSKMEPSSLINLRSLLPTQVLSNPFNNFRCVTTYLAGVDEILIHKLTSTENFEFYDLIKSFMLQADQWIRLERDTLPENHIIVLDIKEYTLAIISKSNIFYFQKFLIFLLVRIAMENYIKTVLGIIIFYPNETS